ncbi:MAG: LicD family protein [Flavobacteriales bacterium]|nr:LicD family protein [Flavobacteriales bacterium]
MNIYKIREQLIGVSNKLGIYSFSRTIWQKVFKGFALNHQAKLFHENAANTLQTLSKALMDNNIQSWLVYGTLLGYAREKDFISHDYDIDLGVFLEDGNKRLEDVLIKHGFTKVREYRIDDGEYGMEQTYELNGVTVDFFYTRKEENEYLAHTFYSDKGLNMNQTIDKYGGLLVTEFSFTPFALQRVLFKDAVFYVPQNYDLYLKEYYGDDYMTPNSNWRTDMAGNGRGVSKIGVRTVFIM